MAPRRPHELVAHGEARLDDYYWLRERSSPDVLAYLQAENEYTSAMMAETASLRSELYQEIVGRIKQDDSSVPVFTRGYYYYRRVEKGRQYAVHCRRRGSLEAPEELVLDVNAVAAGHEYCAVRGLGVSSSAMLLAFAVDTVGRRKYTIRIKDLATGDLLPDRIPEVTGNLVWAADGRTIFYTRQDPKTLRSSRVFRHTLGTDPADDTLIFEETDETFRVMVGRSKSRRFLLIASRQTVSTEYRYLDSSDPLGEWRIVAPRERNHEYEVDHIGDRFIISTNREATNFRLMQAPESDPGVARWQELVPHRDNVYLQDAELFDEYLVLTERRHGLSHIRIIPWDGRHAEHEIAFDEPAYVVRVGDNPEPDVTTLRFVYTSLRTPWSVYDYDMYSRERTLLKRTTVLGGFDPHDYVTERLMAPAPDSALVPISLVRRTGTQLDGESPLMLYGYGAYGLSTEPWFRSERLSLLDRGFIFAIAHVRGGQEMGRQWYENGRLLKKQSTFSDFIACAEHLIARGYTSPSRLYAGGGSAGGLLVGAVANLRPDLFHGIIAAVPWVDVVTTMLDSSIPLTTIEYDEWGNPNDPVYYRYMLSYSPYDNVRAVAYPHMLVTTGLHDSQVQYWEPAKWVAKMRAIGTGDSLLLLKTEMGAGHGGPSGRYRHYEETAFEYAFLLMALEMERT